MHIEWEWNYLHTFRHWQKFFVLSQLYSVEQFTTWYFSFCCSFFLLQILNSKTDYRNSYPIACLTALKLCSNLKINDDNDQMIQFKKYNNSKYFSNSSNFGSVGSSPVINRSAILWIKCFSFFLFQISIRTNKQTKLNTTYIWYSLRPAKSRLERKE